MIMIMIMIVIGIVIVTAVVNGVVIVWPDVLVEIDLFTKFGFWTCKVSGVCRIHSALA